MATKGKNGAASPDKKRGKPRFLKRSLSKQLRRPRAKATAPPKGSGSKMMLASLARKIETPKGPRRPGLPSKASLSKGSSKKQKPRARGQGGETLRFCLHFYSLTNHHSTYSI